MADAQPAILITTHCPAHYYSLLTTRYSQWPGTADAHPAIRAMQRLLAELLAVSEPGVVEAVAEKTEAGAEVVGAAAEAGPIVGAGAAGVAALGGACTVTAFEVTMSSTSNLLL